MNIVCITISNQSFHTDDSEYFFPISAQILSMDKIFIYQIIHGWKTSSMDESVIHRKNNGQKVRISLLTPYSKFHFWNLQLLHMGHLEIWKEMIMKSTVCPLILGTSSVSNQYESANFLSPNLTSDIFAASWPKRVHSTSFERFDSYLFGDKRPWYEF